MNRRTILTVAIAAFAGCSANNAKQSDNTTPTESTAELDPVTDPPDDVEATQELAYDFTEELHGYFPKTRVFITENGEIALEHPTDQTDADGFTAEVHRIADLYASVVVDHDVVPLLIFTDEVQAVVPEDSLDAYASDELEQDAFHETISYMEAPRE